MKNNKRKSAYMQITRKCNNECVFCSNPPFDKEIGMEELEKRLLFYKGNGINEIIFSGGEPTENNILVDAIHLAKKLGFETKIITNGVNLSDLNYVKKLKKNGLEHLHVSIHSHIEKDLDFLTNRKGHFKKTVKGISNCIKEGICVDINTTLNSVNAKYLSDFINYFVVKFPEIKHFVFNNLDVGEADSVIKSRAWKNKWVIAKLIKLELELSKTAHLLMSKGKTFRIERVPLCYMNGFEQFCTETRKIIKKESYQCIFIEKDRGDVYVKVDDPSKERRYKGKVCNSCKLNKICAGLSKDYYELFGDSELFPVFENPNEVILKVKSGCNEKT